MGCYASRRQRPDLVATSFETSALPKPITNKAPGTRNELPPVSWTTKLKSKKQEAFHVYKSGIEA